MTPLNTSRRTLLGGAVAGGVLTATGFPTVAQAAAPKSADRRRPPGQTSMIGVPYAKRDVARIAFIGLGNRGQGMLPGWAAVPGAQITAVCDIRTDRATRAADRLVALGKPRPAVFGGSADAYKQMLERDDIDFVYVATPWEFHYIQARDSMLAGKNVGTELPIATELHELWDLVNTSEKTRKHCMLMENCSYGRNELVMLKAAHDGAFGDITNGHGGYLHDLRDLLFNDGYYTDDWRRLWHTRSIASFYAMHGLAPIAAAMDINRGDRFTTLRATGTKSAGLADYRERFVPRSHRSWSETYINPDLVTCLIETAKGRVVRAEHDVSSPRPYSRINSIAGTRGIMEDYPERVYIEPRHGGHAWGNFAPFRDEYDHWLWRVVGDDAVANGGHGGMDYIMMWRVTQQIRLGQVPDIDVYDSAVWCSPVPLSVTSQKAGGAPVAVPDFTYGDWSRLRLGLDSQQSAMPAVR